MDGKIYAHWSEFPMSEWRWPDFSPQEMASRGDGELMVDYATMDKLQALRTLCGRPIIITSAYRSDIHNKNVGGAKGSKHKEAKAYDVRMDNHDPYVFFEQAKQCGFTGFGGYRKQNFMHIDTGPARSWGKWWPESERQPIGEQLPVEPPEEKPVAKDEGVQAVGALGGAAVVKEVGGVVSKLHPDAQLWATGAAIVLCCIGLYLGWNKIKRMLA